MYVKKEERASANLSQLKQYFYNIFIFLLKEAMKFFKNVKQHSDFPKVLSCIIEIPKGSKNKYEIDKSTGLLKLDRVLHSSIHYPANYGFIPNSKCEDGDELDVLVLSQEAINPLTLVLARPIGVFSFKDGGLQDDKIITVCKDDPEYSDLMDISDLSQHKIKEMEHFFKEYKALENKKVEFLGTSGFENSLISISNSFL